MSAITAADATDPAGADTVETGGAAETLDEQPRLTRFASRVSAGFLALALLLAAYTGFRMPNLWSVTLMSVSIADGFRRRVLVGTLLRPIAESRNFTYWFYAAVAFAILGALLVALVVAAVRSQLLTQRFLVIAFLLLPTGGYLFQEVGYLDQLIYLLLFASLFVVHRSYWWLAPAFMTLAVLTHEIALLTAIPVFVFVAIRVLEPRRAIVSLGPPALVGLVVLAVPASARGASDDFTALLVGANWKPRPDALSLFDRTQAESLDLYDWREVLYFLIPVVIIGLGAFLLMYAGERRPAREPVLATWAQGHDWLYPVLAVAAIASPTLLMFGGWDKWRWGFLILANLFIVTWIWVGERGRELDTTQLVTLALSLLVTVHVGLLYFDLREPRDLSAETWRDVRAQIEDGTFFDIPAR